MAAFLFSPLAPCKLLCLVLGRVRKKEQFLAAVMLVVSGSGRISKLTFYSRFSSLVSLTFPTRTSQCCSNESGNSSPHGRLNLQHSGSQLQGSTLLLGQFILPGSAHRRGSWETAPGHFLPARDTFGQDRKHHCSTVTCANAIASKALLFLSLPSPQAFSPCIF